MTREGAAPEGTAANHRVTQPTASIALGGDFAAELAKCTGLDDPRWRAVELLADAWQPALAAAQRLGYENGYAAGCWQAEHDMAEAWARVAEQVRSTLAAPTHAQLAGRRGEAA